MRKIFNLSCLSLSIILGSLSALNNKAYASVTTGSDIYCTMRQGGNNHEKSWIAAYTNIKKQRSGFFKTSPKQAANMIVEQVVADTEKYEECIPFLGDLYTSKVTPKPKDSMESMTTDPEILEYSPSKGEYKNDRYSY
ncbi:DUF6554 family protein [Prochlorococcus sp. MIT 1223]|uniref:DUF6554 family protein n=1 Tax=Prochlorococcus sp. MIT 1223 TaxID=3096217 RepID=UPI002A75329C|nr:DUF6554 family protein [Prochlorococcus sp. MIT 1223]